MTDKKNVRSIGTPQAKKELLTASELLKHAEAIIRFDKEAAMRSQQGVSDLVAPSNDQREATAPRTSSLDELCGKAGTVRVQSTATPQNVVPIGTRKKD